MTTGEFVQAKFSIFVLLGTSIFLIGVNLVLLMFASWYPNNELIPGMADWILKAAIGPTIGALINTLQPVRADGRREESSDFKGSMTEHTETKRDVVKPAEEPVPDDK